MLKVDYAKGMTTDESVKKALENRYDVCEVLTTEILSDCDREPHAALQLYADANEHERAVMDALLINLCGWSMNSIINFAEERGCIEEE